MNPRETFFKTFIVLATVAVGYILFRLGETIIVLFVAIIVASSIRPVVEALVERGLPRGLSILSMYVIFLVSLAALLVLVIPPLVGLTIELVSGNLLMEQLSELATDLVVFGWQQFRVILPIFDMPEQFQTLMNDAYATAEGQAWIWTQSGLRVVGHLLLALVMGFYWLSARQEILDLFLRLSPVGTRSRLELIWNDVEGTLGAYVRGQVILMASVGVAAFVGLMLLRVPYALALAVFAGLTEMIPMVGPFLGGIPAVMVAMTVSPLRALLIAVWYVLVQQVENHVLVPQVMKHNVGLNPLVVILALAAGSRLNGVVGALLAVPVAGALQVIARHLWIEPALEKSAIKMTNGAVLLQTDDQDKEQSEGLVVAEAEDRDV